MGRDEPVVSLELGMHTDSLMEEKSSISSAGPQTAHVGDHHGFATCRLCGTQPVSLWEHQYSVVEFVDHLVTTGWVLEMWDDIERKGALPCCKNETIT